MNNIFFYLVLGIFLYIVFSCILNNFYNTEHFDPSLVPVSSIISLAKIAQKIVNGNGILSNPGNLILGSSAIPGSLTVNGTSTLSGNTTINGTLTVNAGAPSNTTTLSSTTISGGLSAGASTLSSATISGALSAGASTLSSATISSTLNAGVSTLSSATISGALSAGASTLSSTTISGALKANTSTLGATTVNGAVTVNGPLTVSTGNNVTVSNVIINGLNVVDRFLKLTIISAMYGFDVIKRYNDLVVLANTANTNMTYTITYTANNAVYGDPMPGMPKLFKVDWKCGTTAYSGTWGENQAFTISCK